MDIVDILKLCDHTLLSTTASWEEIRNLCDDGIGYNCASVCIPPCFVKPASEYVQKRIPICTVVGFPNGYNTFGVKAMETSDALFNGADEIDMVVNLCLFKEGIYDKVLEEIETIRHICDGHILKVIIEACLLDRDEKIRMCDIVAESGADFIKTSTGFSKGGATFEDVALLRKYSPPEVKVKAAGGISTIEDAEKFIELGAERLGTSRIVKLAKALETGK